MSILLRVLSYLIPRPGVPAGRRDFVISKADWICEKQEAVRERHPHIANEIATGEIHLLEGRPRRLEVLETAGRRRVEPRPDGSISLFIRHDDSAEMRRAILQECLRELKRVAGHRSGSAIELTANGTVVIKPPNMSSRELPLDNRIGSTRKPGTR